MSPEEIEVSEGISRRRMLKRIGAGAAVAWSAPILTSIKTPAFAQSGPPPPPPPCEGCSACPSQQACNDNSNCQCWMSSPDNGNTCVCNAFVGFCGDTPLCPGGQGDCDSQLPGSTCVQTCCGQICAPPCGGAQSKVKRGKGGAKTTR
jgi:hypothetical protein